MEPVDVRPHSRPSAGQSGQECVEGIVLTWDCAHSSVERRSSPTHVHRDTSNTPRWRYTQVLDRWDPSKEEEQTGRVLRHSGRMRVEEVNILTQQRSSLILGTDPQAESGC